MFNLLVVPAASSGTLCQLSDLQLDLLMFVATGLGPMVSLKDLRVGTRGELSLGLMLKFRSQIIVICNACIQRLMISGLFLQYSFNR